MSAKFAEQARSFNREAWESGAVMENVNAFVSQIMAAAKEQSGSERSNARTRSSSHHSHGHSHHGSSNWQPATVFNAPAQGWTLTKSSK